MAKARRSMHRKLKTSRKSKTMRRRQRGGALSPADINDSTMLGPSNQNLNQGKDYLALHAGQHGGAGYQYANQAPVGDQGLLDASLRGAARLLPLDASTAAASGMSDQAGGARKGRVFNWKSLSKRFGMGKARKGKSMYNRFRKSLRNSYRKVSRAFKAKSKKSKGKSMYNRFRKSLRNSYRKVSRAFKAKSKASRKMHGGAGYQYANQADYASPGMLLSPGMEAKALGGMNPEWKFASDPSAFAPK